MSSAASQRSLLGFEQLLAEAEAMHVTMGVTPQMKLEIDVARRALRVAQRKRAATSAWATRAASELAEDVRAAAALVDAKRRERAAAAKAQVSRGQLREWEELDERCAQAQARILQAQKVLELVQRGKADSFVV